MTTQGHWRTLKSNQVGEGRYGEATSGKTWVDREETKKTKEAKKVGEVPPPVAVGRKGDFVAFAVPGGRYMFVVHKSLSKIFSEITSQKGWLKSGDVKKFMSVAEEKGMFGIFKTEKQIIGYQ